MQKRFQLVLLIVVLLVSVYGSLLYFLGPREAQKVVPYTMRCFISGQASSPKITFNEYEIVDGLWVLKADGVVASYRPLQGEVCLAVRR